MGDGGGQGIECHVAVVNDLDLTDPNAPVTSSTVTVTTCLGSADAALAGVCTSSGPVTYSELVTNVDQCNYAVNGGGSTLLCTVDVLNYVTGDATVGLPTVNECNGSVTTGDVVACDTYLPSLTTDPSTADVVQCNDSANGGGSVLDCSLQPGSSTVDALTVTINQCNNSANGGGSKVICRATIRSATRANVVVAYTPTNPVTDVPVNPGVVSFVLVPTESSPGTTGVGAGPTGETSTPSASTLGTARFPANRPVLANTGEDGSRNLPMGVALLAILIGIGGLARSHHRARVMRAPRR